MTVVRGSYAAAMRGRTRPTLGAALALTLLASGCINDDGVPDLVTGPTSVAVAEIVAASAPDTPRAETQLDDCPIDGYVQLIDDAVALVDDPPVVAALGGVGQGFVTSTADSYPATVVCALTSADGSLAIEVSTAPSDLDVYAVSLEDRFGPPFDHDESGEFRGGRFHQLCSVDLELTDRARCEVVWIDDLVRIGLSVTGAGANDVLLDDVEERFAYVVPLVVERFIPAAS